MRRQRRIITILLFVILVPVIVNIYNLHNKTQGMVLAFGPLTVTFPSEPMFSELNWFPGKEVAKTILIENTDNVFHSLAIKALNTQSVGDPALSKVIEIRISRNGTVHYGSNNQTGKKSLYDFFKESVVNLPALSAGEKTSYNIILRMDDNAGDEFQEKSTLFDLSVGIESFGISPISTINLIPKVPLISPIPTIKPFPEIRFFTPYSFSFFRK